MSAKSAMAKRDFDITEIFVTISCKQVLKSLLYLSFFGSICASMIYGSWWLFDPVRWPIQSVQIKGEFKFLDEGELKQVIAPLASGGFFQVDVQRIQEALVKLPWVDGVSIRRIWPDTLSVTVTEQVPLTRWNDDSLLNQYGEAFTPTADSIPQALPLLKGPAGREEMMARRYAEVETKLAASGLHLHQMQMDERRSWVLSLSNGIELLLGKADFELRLQRFLEQYPGLLLIQTGQIAQIDLRYTNGFSISWKPAAETALEENHKGEE